MAKYDTLRTLAFEIDRAAGMAMPHHYYVIEFPESWKRPLVDLARRNSSSSEAAVPIRSLNAGIRALAPDIISIAKNAAREGSRPWLYSTAPVNTAALALIAAKQIGGQES